jgi:hypothetical protein
MFGTESTLGDDSFLPAISARTGQKLVGFTASGSAEITVTGAKGGNAALASLITALANYGIIVDSTT